MLRVVEVERGTLVAHGPRGRCQQVAVAAGHVEGGRDRRQIIAAGRRGQRALVAGLDAVAHPGFDALDGADAETLPCRRAWSVPRRRPVVSNDPSKVFAFDDSSTKMSSMPCKKPVEM
jgi:hypothetical protein